MSVFEVGCGGGAFLYPLYRNGLKVAGIDYASNLVHLAKLAMPEGSFEVLDAKDLVVDGLSAQNQTRRADVVLANSVFQYFDSLNKAEAVLLRMFKLAESTVAVLNVPDLMLEMEEMEATRNALPVNVYEEMYNDLKHLYLERNWFVMMGKREGWKAHIIAQQIPNYGKNEFRYNVVFKKVTTN
jgi:2-polyprenyl-3-methyl-5-hydroxy-6-metoxy-1,4-benzoquinol methylase